MKNFSLKSFKLVFLFSFISSISYSQETQNTTVTGTVKTLKNIVVVGAEVKATNSKVKVLTDSLGNFKILCSFKDKIKISAKGFYTKKLKIDEKTKDISVELNFKRGKKNVDLALGYGHIKEKDKSFAISSFKNDDQYKFSKYSNMLELIINSSPSIVVSNGNIIIRGTNSLFGSNAALIIINGMDSTSSQLFNLPTADVKSVEILKDGSSAIYGARGANGVVIVTTKNGKDD
ncbi:TonB-dependent receptor plug domain-containing protein [Winogradskyella ursingii]|uniref:TonB-dependent receptor plug domain-containing protein n=1 Tax=Winogradskyella ursingii TaxID=2686079 RepID=UPI0015CA4FF1|nr:TonB-dependent receptor plug domain-containing protein [Winogradskyella ursingii]